MLLYCRNKRKFKCGDELFAISQAMQGLQVVNGLECKIACNSSKVLHTSPTSVSNLKHYINIKEVEILFVDM